MCLRSTKRITSETDFLLGFDLTVQGSVVVAFNDPISLDGYSMPAKIVPIDVKTLLQAAKVNHQETQFSLHLAFQ